MTDDITRGRPDGQPTEQDLIDFTRHLAATEGQLAPDPEPGGLSDAHAGYLAAQAIDVGLARALGVRTVADRSDLADLGPDWERYANFPAILFPWTSPDGRVECQLRPDDPTTDNDGRLRKYLFRRGMTPVLWALRPAFGVTWGGPGCEQVLIVEGTKQALAAASYAPSTVEVYGIAGCRSWQVDGVPIGDLGVVDGRAVVVILDADAAGNPDVYAAGVGLAEALAAEGATSVRFTRMPAAGKSGLDDVLAGRPADRRAGYLARLVDGARPKPADKVPGRKKRPTGDPGADSARPAVDVTGDRLDVIEKITSAMIDKWDRRELFSHGGVISRLEPGWSLGQARMHPVTRGTFNNLVVQATMPVSIGADGSYRHGWPDGNTMSAVLAGAGRFTALDQVVTVPHVRPDGSVCAKTGYDEATRTLLVPSADLGQVEVPEHPSLEQVARARDLILKEWLGDMPFDEPSRANALALVLTPFIRGLVPLAPLAVIDGLQMGVGKNLLADCLAILVTGRAADPLPYTPDDVEQRKVITSTFRSGASLFVFDEAHDLQGASFARAITALTYSDRVLGVSELAEFPNRTTWLSLGNNVVVRGDMTRRVYRIRLAPAGANPENRPLSMYRHADLRGWTAEHRTELVTAALTLVRAWFAAGRPVPPGEMWFGSFEAWQRICGGVCQLADVPGFLDNVREWRSETDFWAQYRAAHLEWLREQFGAHRIFTAAEVRARAMADPAGYQAPDNLDDPTARHYAKDLGMHYSKIAGRHYEGLMIVKDRPQGKTRKAGKWMVLEVGEGTFPPGQSDPVPGDQPDPPGSGRTDPVPHDLPGPTDPGEPAPVLPDGSDGRDGRGLSRNEMGSGGSGVNQGEVPHSSSVENFVRTRAHTRIREGEESSYSPGFTAPHPGGPEQGVDTSVDVGDPVRPDLNDEIRDEPAIYRSQTGSWPPNVVAFDLETGDAGDLYRCPVPFEYVRLAGWTVDDQPVEVQQLGAVEVADAIQLDGGTVTGHNVMAFDLPALVRAGRLTMAEVHQLARDGRLFDTLLAARHLDPPMAREKGVDAQRRHDLDSLGERLFGIGKTGKLADLAKAHGGYDQIPTDLPEYRQYLVRDVELSRRLHRELADQLAGLAPAQRAYLDREHRVAAVAAQITHNGFLVDQATLTARVTEIRRRKAGSLALLHERYGVPLADGKGRAYDAPLATKAGKAALAQALRAAGATSLWTTEKTGEIALGGEHMLHLSREYQHLPAVREIAKHVYRVVSARTVYETVAAHLCPDGRVHPRVAFKQATGRWSLTEPGLTVMGKRAGRHVEREVFLPDPGEVAMAFDLAQVDMRAVAGLSQDLAYIRMLATEDPHSEIALALFGSVQRREQAKAIGHGWNYGRGIRAISEGEGIEPGLVRQFDASMRERFPRLVQWQGEVRAVAESGELLDNGWGRRMRPDPRRAHTQGPALMGQGAARDIMMEGLLRLADAHPDILPMLRAQVHDEVVLSVPVDQVQDVRRAVVQAMTFEWNGVPIVADSSPTGPTWGHVYQKG